MVRPVSNHLDVSILIDNDKKQEATELLGIVTNMHLTSALLSDKVRLKIPTHFLFPNIENIQGVPVDSVRTLAVAASEKNLRKLQGLTNTLYVTDLFKPEFLVSISTVLVEIASLAEEKQKPIPKKKFPWVEVCALGLIAGHLVYWFILYYLKGIQCN